MKSCFTGVTGAAEDDFSGSMDGLSRVAGVAGTAVGLVVAVCGKVVGIGGSKSGLLRCLVVWQALYSKL